MSPTTGSRSGWVPSAFEPPNWWRAIEGATGEFVKLVGQDDLLAPECLERRTAALRANPGAALRRLPPAASSIPDGATLRAAHGLRGLDGLVPAREARRLVVGSGMNILGEPVTRS